MKATLWRALGALIGGAAGVAGGIGIRKAFDSGPALVLVALIAVIAVSVVLYLVARAHAEPDTPAGELLPGLMIGVNTGINAALLGALFGPVVAIVICLIPLLAVIAPLARSNIYQGFLGWVNFLLPMSWPVVALGLLFTLASGLLALINLALRTAFLKIEHLAMDAKTGTTFLVGGLAGNANLRSGSTGFNMGSFAFLKAGQATGGYLMEHEAGHTLNLGIWGFVVHFIGALDENVFGGNDRAYTELFAEGNVPASDPSRGPTFPMWSEPAPTSSPVAPPKVTIQPA